MEGLVEADGHSAGSKGGYLSALSINCKYRNIIGEWAVGSGAEPSHNSNFMDMIYVGATSLDLFHVLVMSMAFSSLLGHPMLIFHSPGTRTVLPCGICKIQLLNGLDHLIT